MSPIGGILVFVGVLLISPFGQLEAPSSAASAATGSYVNGHGVRDGADGPGVVHYCKLNGVQPDLLVGVADSGSSACRAVSEIPDKIDQPAVGIVRGGGIEQNVFPENWRVAGEPAAGNGCDVFNVDDEFSRIGLTGAIQNRQSHSVFPRLLVALLGLNPMNGIDILIRELPGVIENSGIVIGERAGQTDDQRSRPAGRRRRDNGSRRAVGNEP